MREVSELIYETCKTYLVTQGKFILLLELFIGAVMVLYFGVLRSAEFTPLTTAIIVLFSLVGIAGSYGVAWFGIRINTYANSRCAFASLAGKPYPIYAIPLQAGISIGTLLICVELAIMLAILLFVPGQFAGPCFIGFAIGESLGAAALRIAGGIFTKIADIGADLMKIVFKIDEDDARNPGVIADCTGDNAGDSVGPTADGFETYGVTGVALIVFISAGGRSRPRVQVQLALVWIFVMRVMMVITSVLAYAINQAIARAKYAQRRPHGLREAADLAGLAHVVDLGRRDLRRVVPADPRHRRRHAVVEALDDHHLRHAGRGDHSRVREGIHLDQLGTREGNRYVVARRRGVAQYSVRLHRGQFQRLLDGSGDRRLDGHRLWRERTRARTQLMLAPSVFAFGLVAFGFLGMGPVTIAVDSYGPVADNAQSVFELSTIQKLPNISAEIKQRLRLHAQLREGQALPRRQRRCGQYVQGDGQAGADRHGGRRRDDAHFLDHPDAHRGAHDATRRTSRCCIAPFLLGLISGGAIIYWFTGASTQAVLAGAYRAVEFIKANIQLGDESSKASLEDSKRVVEICTQYAQKGMFNIFLAVFFTTLAFACIDSYFFIGYLISIAIFGLYQAIFMANAGGAWDNAKKIVEVELREKGTPLHAAAVVGDTVGDPFKDTSSVAMNPIIKFTTLFGLLAVELAITIPDQRVWVGVGLFLVSMVFVWRSFYRMRITAPV